jgi:hypothetical protein
VEIGVDRFSYDDIYLRGKSGISIKGDPLVSRQARRTLKVARASRRRATNRFFGLSLVSPYHVFSISQMSPITQDSVFKYLSIKQQHSYLKHFLSQFIL